MNYYVRRIVVIGINLMLFSIALHAQRQNFSDYFENKSLRIDYQLVGNHESEQFVLVQKRKYDWWAGPKQCIDFPTIMGNYRINVYDSVSASLIYSTGFSGLFNEWQTTLEAKTTVKSYYHVNVVPFPKKTIRMVLEKYQPTTGKFVNVGEFNVNPNDYFIIDEKPFESRYTLISGNGSDKNIDIAFLAEGYQQKQMQKFRNDVKRIWQYITTIEPFKSYAGKFNIYAVESVSEQSGTDIPGRGTYVNTVFNSTFYTFDIERYVTTSDIKSLHDKAAVVPYEHLFVLINSEKYGGGGFYNFYAATTTDNELSLKVAIHEFGHSFAGLADEYYNSEVAYSDFYNLTVEPWEPNITTLVDFNSKWKSMLNDTIPVPTPRIKKYFNVLGVFEGGGYLSKGIFSPMHDCRMKSNKPQGFCPVCTKAIEQCILEQTKE